MPRYKVGMRISDDPDANVCWHTTVECWPREFLDDGELERRAIGQAIEAFGPQAAGWTLIDAVRTR
jgi:hypothetical protein